MPALRLSDFGVEQHLGFTLAGRRFAVLLPSSALPSANALDTANAALRSFTVKPGHYYGQALPPARFPPRSGWFVGARGGKLYAEGGQTETWAATVPYRDQPAEVPPHETLSQLPATGVVIQVILGRDSVLRQGRSFNSLRISRERIEDNFEGLPKGVSFYRASVSGASYDISLWIFFKALHPSPRVIALAQQELDRLRLPSWPAG